MDVSKLPPPEDDTFVRAALNASDEAASKALANAELHVKAQGHASSGLTYLQKEQARHAASTAFSAVSALHAIHLLAKKLAATTFSKSLDEAAYESMGELAERLERLEANLQEVSDDGFRYRGYWRDGSTAKRGDAFTHDGSVWWAARNTKDKPCNESADWHVAVRKGRDGRDSR